MINECIAKMLEADGIILGSPIYFADITPPIKALIDRADTCQKLTTICSDACWRAVIAVRRAGLCNLADSLNHFFISQMIVPGSLYWNTVAWKGKGEVEKDEEGKQIMKVLGQNMAWFLKLHL